MSVVSSTVQWPGGSHHITYTVTCRLAWGMRGSWFALFFRVMPALVWDGIEAWWGGQAVSTMIGTWSLTWANWDYPIANDTAQLKDFIGCRFLFSSLFLLMKRIPSSQNCQAKKKKKQQRKRTERERERETDDEICLKEWQIHRVNAFIYIYITTTVILYHIVFLGVMWLPPEKLHRPFQVSFIGFTLVIFGLVGWSTHVAGGAGQYFRPDYQPPAVLAGSVGWASVYGATAVLGNTAVVTMGGSAWCRFARDNKTSMAAQVIACPVFVYLAFALGILVTSASSDVLGAAYWQPFELMRYIQAHYDNSAGARAAIFFASAACALAQVCVNIILNSVAAAMDMAAYHPRWLTIRRCSYIVAAGGVITNPWQITTTAATFIQVLSGFGTFYGPISGILVADFWIVRKRLIKMRDLYIGNEESIYWYSHG